MRIDASDAARAALFRGKKGRKRKKIRWKEDWLKISGAAVINAVVKYLANGRRYRAANSNNNERPLNSFANC